MRGEGLWTGSGGSGGSGGSDGAAASGRERSAGDMAVVIARTCESTGVRESDGFDPETLADGRVASPDHRAGIGDDKAIRFGGTDDMLPPPNVLRSANPPLYGHPRVSRRDFSPPTEPAGAGPGAICFGTSLGSMASDVRAVGGAWWFAP